ncbi:hypothetical protein ACI77F_06690 [Pseudomonas tritici]
MSENPRIQSVTTADIPDVLGFVLQAYRRSREQARSHIGFLVLS